MTGKKRKKGKINEDDTIKTMNRYDATTILTLLQEVAQSADVKIDWKTIVERSSTGISNPQEYQLLWRHLAYCEPMPEEIDGAEPTDDDSDLEFELEIDPTVSAEVTSQAQECVKVLMSTRFSSVSASASNSAMEVPNVLEPSDGPASNTTPSDKKDAALFSVKNTTPVSLHKQMAPTSVSLHNRTALTHASLHNQTAPTHVSLHNQTASTGPAAKGFEGNDAAGVGSANRNGRAEGFDGNDAGVSLANRNGRAEGFEGNDTAGPSSSANKKRKLWTEEEDAELIAAVQRCGVGNWVTVLKEHFVQNRTASQLSKRWTTLKKRCLLTSNTSQSSNSISLAKSGVLDAARLAINNALGKPMARSYSVTNAGPVHSVTPPKANSPFSHIVPEALHIPSPPQKPNLVQEASDTLLEIPNQAPPGKGNVSPSSKCRSTPKRSPASVEPKTRRTVKEASAMVHEIPNQAAPGKGNLTPSSKRQSTPKLPPASVRPETKRTVQEALNQAAPEKGNTTPSSKPLNTTSSLIKAAAFAAGGRIAAPSAVASLLQAAQAKNIIRIRAGGSQLTPTVSRSQQQASACYPLPFRMPLPSRNSLMMSNRSTVSSHQKRNSSKVTVKLPPATRAQPSSSSPASAEKMLGQGTSSSNGNRRD